MKDLLSEVNPEILLADGFDEAILGYVERFGMSAVALYDLEKCIQILVNRDGMTYEEAVEYIDYNVLGAYVGENTPCFATLLKDIV